jgi:hypothetical protein
MHCLLFLSYEVANVTLQDVYSSALKKRDTLHYDTLKGQTMAEQYHRDMFHPRTRLECDLVLFHSRCITLMSV